MEQTLSGSTPSSSKNGSSPFLVGDNTDLDPWHGWISHIALWDMAFDDTQLSAVVGELAYHIGTTVIAEGDEAVPAADRRSTFMSFEPIFIMADLNIHAFNTTFNGTTNEATAKDRLDDSFDAATGIWGTTPPPHIMFFVPGGFSGFDIFPSNPRDSSDERFFGTAQRDALSDWLDENSVYDPTHTPTSDAREFWIHTGFGYQFNDDGTLNDTQYMGSLVRGPFLPAHYKANVLDTYHGYDTRLKRICFDASSIVSSQFARISNDTDILDAGYTFIQEAIGHEQNGGDYLDRINSIATIDFSGSPWYTTDMMGNPDIDDSWESDPGDNQHLMCWVRYNDLGITDLQDKLVHLLEQRVRLAGHGTGAFQVVVDAWDDYYADIPSSSSDTATASTSQQTVDLPYALTSPTRTIDGYQPNTVSISLMGATIYGYAVTSSDTVDFTQGKGVESHDINVYLDIIGGPIAITTEVEFTLNGFKVRVTNPSGMGAVTGNLSYTAIK